MEEKGAPLIRIEHLYHRYEHSGDSTESEPPYSLRDVSLKISRGEYVAIIGANGSGKSTLLRHFNALLLPVSGDVWVAGWNTKDSTKLRDIRSKVGMVFQSPDTQIVATVVEEDVAFGPENLGIPWEELRYRVDWALERVGLGELRKRPAQFLSAGQKQLLAIASALSMHPDCLVLDEATASLDPVSRMRFLDTIDTLHGEGITVIATTHRMEEAARAERVVALSEGTVIMNGDPRTVFTECEALFRLKLDMPETVKIAMGIASQVTGFKKDALTVNELVDAILGFSK